jgi:hypothetical protein
MTATNSPNTSPAAVRMRRHRQRRREGLRSLTIEVRESEISALVRHGLLQPAARSRPGDIVKALYAFLDRTLGS